jgi:hypothetical protein
MPLAGRAGAEIETETARFTALRRPIQGIADANVHDPVKNQTLQTELSFEHQLRQLVRRLQ